MPIIALPNHRVLPPVHEPGTVVGLTVLVSVQCACGAVALGLVNAQPAVCEACGTVFSLESVAWEAGGLTPKIVLRSSPSRAQALSS